MSLTRKKMIPALSSLSAFSTSVRRISTLFLLLLLFAQVDSHNRSGEVHTISKFKSLLERGSPTRTLEYWITWKKMDKTPDPCDWYGVTYAANSSVEQLNLWHLKQLSSLGLLSNLQDLRKLDFSPNDFREKCNDIGISQDTQTLTGLAPLDLSNNAFSGPIPPIISASRSRQYFSLEENVLIGEIPDLSGLVRYPSYERVVDLSNNVQSTTTVVNPDPLTAVLEFFLRNTSITEFRMRGISLLETPLPSSVPASLTSILQVLDMNYSHLQGKIMGVAFNSTWPPVLQSLESSNNDIIGPLPDAIVMLPNLVVLDVTNNMLSGPLPRLPNKLNKRDIFFAQDNPGLCEDPQFCGGPLRPCPQWSGVQTSVLQTWWFVMITIGEFVIIAVGSFSIAVWRWRVYRRRHQQDADLIKTLLERESAALMSLRDLKKATNNFADSAQIGEGGFGTVYAGKLSDGTMVAIKRSKREGSEKEKEQFLNEVRILSQVKHRHLVKLLGCCMENKVALLVFEFVPNGTLQEHLQRKIGTVPLSWRQRLRIAVQTADALNYLHSAATFPIYHRDIKSANVLLNDELSVRVADFGVSKLSNSVEATHISTLAIQGTRGYIDPEYFTSYQLTDKSDVYSFGVVLLELISAKSAIDFGRGEEDAGLVCFAQKHIERGDLQQLIDGALRETYNDLAGQGRESILHMGRLAIKCLHMRSKSRPSMNEVWKELQNLWLQLDEPEDSGSLKESSTVSEGAVAEGSAHIVLLSDCFSTDSSGFVLHNDSIGIQMSQFSHLTGIRSASSQQ